MNERPDPSKWLDQNWRGERWNRDEVVKVMREFQAACYRHAAAVARAKATSMSDPRGMTYSDKAQFANGCDTVSDALERLATEMEGEKKP